MPYSFPAFEEITSSFDKEIHKYRTVKDKAQFSELDIHREVPVQFLITMKEQLQASDESNKNRIFAGACLMVKSWLHTHRQYFCSVGTLNDHLDTVLEGTAEHPMSPEDKEEAALAFQEAFFNRVYVDQNPQKDLLAHPSIKEEVSKHSFGCFDTQDSRYTINAFVKETDTLVLTVQNEVKKAEEKAEQKRLAEEAKKSGKSGGFLSWLGGGSADDTQKKSVKESNGMAL